MDLTSLLNHLVKTLNFLLILQHGLVNIILFTCFDFNALTANATAVYVFPVPAGPTKHHIVFRNIIKHFSLINCSSLYQFTF